MFNGNVDPGFQCPTNKRRAFVFGGKNPPCLGYVNKATHFYPKPELCSVLGSGAEAPPPLSAPPRWRRELLRVPWWGRGYAQRPANTGIKTRLPLKAPHIPGPSFWSEFGLPLPGGGVTSLPFLLQCSRQFQAVLGAYPPIICCSVVVSTQEKHW